MHGLWSFPWKQSVGQKFDQVRTNQNVQIYRRANLPYINSLTPKSD